MLRGELRKTVVEVTRDNERSMAVIMQIKERILFTIAACAPQTGCSNDEKEFRDDVQVLAD